MAERLAQDQPQYQQTKNPEETRKAQAEYDARVRNYESELAAFNDDTKKYNIALSQYESELAKQEAEQKAIDDKVKAEAAKIAADQKTLSDLDSKHGAEMQKLLDARTAAEQAVPYSYQTFKMVGSGGGYVQNDGTDVKQYFTQSYSKSQRKSMVNDVTRNYNSPIAELGRQQSSAYQMAAFQITYPDAGALGGSWFRSWQKDQSTGSGSSLSSRYQSELQRQQTQRQESNAASIRKAQGEAATAAKRYSADPLTYSSSILNFGGTDMREFTQKEIDRRAAIKPMPPKAIPTVEGYSLTQSTNRPLMVGVKFDAPTQPALLLRQKEEKALGDFYNQYKSPTTPSVTILEGVVSQATGKPVTKETGIKIAALTAGGGSMSYTRSATYTDPKTGKSFDAKTKTGDIGIARSLGYQDDQNMQRPIVDGTSPDGTTSEETITYFTIDSHIPDRKPMSLANRAIEKGITALDNFVSSDYNPNKLETGVVPQVVGGLALGTLSTVASISNMWTQKVETMNFRGEPLKNNILAPKIEYTDPKTGGFSGYVFLGSVANSLKSSLFNQGGRIQFGESSKEPIRLPSGGTLFGTALEDPSKLPEYIAKRGIAGSIGEGSELLVGGIGKGAGEKLLVKEGDVYANAYTKVTAGKGVDIGKLSDPNYVKNYLKEESLSGSYSGSGKLVPKSPFEVVKGFFTKKGNVAGWRIDDIVKAEKEFNLLPPAQQTKSLTGLAEMKARSQSLARYENKYGASRYSRQSTGGNIIMPSFTGTVAPLGQSLAGVLSKAEITKPRPISTLYDELPYKPANRANEIDLTDSATWKPSFDYSPVASSKPTVPKSVEPKASDSVAASGTFGGAKPSTTPTKRFKSDSEIEKDVKASGGTIDKSGLITMTKQQSKTVQKTVQNTIQKPQTKMQPPRTKVIQKQPQVQIQSQRLKAKLKVRQVQAASSVFGLSSLLKQKQKQKAQQVYKQQYKQEYKQDYKQIYKQDQAYKLKQMQLFRQPQVQKFKQEYKQVAKQKLKAPLRFGTPSMLKIDVPLKFPVPTKGKLKDPPPPEKNITRRIPPFFSEKKKRSSFETQSKKTNKGFLGNTSEVKIEGMYNRTDIVRGEKKIDELVRKDYKKYAPKKKRFSIF